MKKGHLRITYKVSGKNIRNLPVYLHLKKVSVYSFSMLGENESLVNIDYKDRNIFFAICKNMCYNKKVTGYKGILSPFAKAFYKIGVVLGAIAFALSVWFFSGIILNVSVEGSGKRLEAETLSKLESLSIKRLSRFSQIDYREVENAILLANDKISFVSVYKRGNTLVVNVELSSSEDKPLSKFDGDLVCEFDGTIEEVSVLRGTPLVKVGDKVSAGSVLVGAYLEGKDGERFETFVVARVKVLQTLSFEYQTPFVDDSVIDRCYALSKFKLNDVEVVEKSHKINGNKITVTLTVRRVLYGGNS
ncbi:MAG: sporulation protein YqfD [Clostridia bacterium]|nr:sporulation protein YqfD [Clostridia bacterium]